MKNILLVGVGGTGSSAVDTLYEKVRELGKQTDAHFSSIVFDTDAGDIAGIRTATPIPMADTAGVGTICDRIGKKYLREWFPCDDKSIRNQEMVRGASQWRKKSYLAFLNLMNKPVLRKKLTNALEKMVVDPSGACEVYVITSIAGGTGSGSFIPITLFIKRYLRKVLGIEPTVRALIALPGIFADGQTDENKIKVYANGYAVLREINAINLVARNYNDGHAEKKNAPVKFKIGNREEPNVGLLFDSEDPEFWTPTAAPFHQIFVLDKIVGVDGPAAHNIVLANSLYSIICTDIGKEFDSEASNHEILLSQNNGSNAIFAGISSSQIRFPKDSILNYLAYAKTLASCDNEWLKIHDAVELTIQKLDKEARESGRRYSAGRDGYAKLIVEQFQNIARKDSDPVTELVNKGAALYNEQGEKLPETTAEAYFEKIKKHLQNVLPNGVERFNENYAGNSDDMDKEKLQNTYFEYQIEIYEYFKDVVSTIKRNSSTLYEEMFSLEFRKFNSKDDVSKILAQDFSLVKEVLQRDKKYIHPVAAMVQLCRLKLAISKEIANITDWQAISEREVDTYPDDLLYVIEDYLDVSSVSGNLKKSFYSKKGDENDSKNESSITYRFANMEHYCSSDESEYMKSKTNPSTDNELIKADVRAILTNIQKQALKQFEKQVFGKLEKDVDTLIEKYRAFFSRFEKEKENLKEATDNAKKKDSSSRGSVINVYSSKEDKEVISKKIFMQAGPETDTQLAERYNVIGSGVFLSVYRSGVAANDEGITSYNDKDAKPYTDLFASMVQSYSSFIAKSEGFKAINEYNVIQAISERCTNKDDRKEALFAAFSKANELAKPSIKLDGSPDNGEIVKYSQVIVFMLSKETGRYIKRHAEELDLVVPDDEANENRQIKSCTEQFIHVYSGSESARVVIVDNIPNYVIYCTGETMDISPLRIPQFDDFGKGSEYFAQYQIALERQKKYDTDMWNPHLGYELDKPSHLPYINPLKGLEEDTRLVKALFYALKNEIVRYHAGSTMDPDEGFRYTEEGVSRKIYTNEGVVINQKNIAKLMDWMRNRDQNLIVKWAARFDILMNDIKNSLPSVSSEDDIQTLEAAITTCQYSEMLGKELFQITKRGGASTQVSIITLAFLIKESEESTNDYDDAERIIATAYEVFEDICRFRTNPERNATTYIKVLNHETTKMYESFANSKGIQKTSDPEAQFRRISQWLIASGYFRIKKEAALITGNTDDYETPKYTGPKVEKVEQ